MIPVYCGGDHPHTSTSTRKVVGYKTVSGIHVYAASIGHTTDLKVAICNHDLTTSELTGLSLTFFMRSKNYCSAEDKPQTPFMIIGDEISLLKDPIGPTLEIGVLGLEEEYG